MSIIWGLLRVVCILMALFLLAAIVVRILGL
jgi:hypothetical protein